MTEPDPLAPGEHSPGDPLAGDANAAGDPVATVPNGTPDPLATESNDSVDPLATDTFVSPDPLAGVRNRTGEPDPVAVNLQQLHNLIGLAEHNYRNPSSEDLGDLALRGTAILLHRRAVELRRLLGDPITRRRKWRL
jgi:hypothetical protein